MKKNLSLVFSLIAWFAVLTQYYLMIENRTSSIVETTIRFFSYFTILTNSLVAIYFTLIAMQIKPGFLKIIDKPGTLTAITVYITTVGLVYQILLRHIWEPKGLQMIVDELLHTLIPIMVIIFWYFYENKALVIYKQIPKWLVYPLVYLSYILVSGKVSNFYPYPFIDVATIGLLKVLMNAVGLAAFFFILSAIFIRVGKAIK